MFTNDPMKRVLGWAAISGLVVGIIASLITIWLAGEVQAVWFVLLIPAFLVATVASANAHYGAEPFHLQQWTPFAPRSVRTLAIDWFKQRGFDVHYDDRETLSFRPRKPFGRGAHGIVGDVQALIGPRGPQVLTLMVMKAEGGSEVHISVDKRRWGGEATAIAFFNSLHEFA